MEKIIYKINKAIIKLLSGATANNIMKTVLWMTIFTFMSKLSGFIREMVLAGCYGTSYITDAYVMANAIPNIIFGGVFAAVATAFLPTFSRIKELKGKEEADIFTSQIINLLIILSTLVSIIGFFYSDQIVTIFASGFNEQTSEVTSYFIKITFLYIILNSISGVVESYLQYKNVFIPQIASGIIQNFGVILIIVISVYTNHLLLAFGMLLGSLLKFVIMIFIAKRKGYKYSRSLSINQSVKEIIGLALPVFIGANILQINTFVDKTLASRLIGGSVSALNYGMLLVNMIYGLTISVLVMIIYPKITRANSIRDMKKFDSILNLGITLVILVLLPFTFGSLAYSEQVVQVIYERGAFDYSATVLTESAFFYYSIGLIFMGINDVLNRAYYSMQNMRTPMYFAAFSVIINIVLNLILVQYMELGGLALASSISYASNTLLLFYDLKKRYPFIHIFTSRKKYERIILSTVLAISISLISNIILEDIFTSRVIILTLSVSIAIIFYVIFLKLFNVPEIKLLKLLFKSK